MAGAPGIMGAPGSIPGIIPGVVPGGRTGDVAAAVAAAAVPAGANVSTYRDRTLPFGARMLNAFAPGGDGVGVAPGPPRGDGAAVVSPSPRVDPAGDEAAAETPPKLVGGGGGGPKSPSFSFPGSTHRPSFSS